MNRTGAILFLFFLLMLSGCAKPLSTVEVLSKAGLPDKLHNSGKLKDISSSGEELNTSDPLQNLFYMFNDNILNELMAKALEKNPDVLILASKIRQARSQVAITGGDLFPKVGLGLDYTYSETSNNLNLSGTFSWEVDIFGKTQARRNAMKESFFAAEQELLGGRVSLLSDVAVYYFNIRGYIRNIKIAKEIEENYKTLVGVYKEQLALGLAEASDVLSAENDYFNAGNTVKDLEIELEKSRNALLTLTDTRELGFEFQENYEMPEARIPSVETIPTQALINRPDVKSSLVSLNAEFYKTAGTKASLYPSLTLSGNIGQIIASSIGPADIIWQVAASLAAPLLNRKELYENLNIQREAEKQARYSLQKVINTALSEIENSIFQLSSADDVLKSSRSLLKNISETFSIATLKYENGLTDEVEFLQSRNEILNARMSLGTSELKCVTASVNLYKAFGGSFGKPLGRVDYGTDK